MKGVSQLITTILLIAFTLGVTGIISVWLTGFARTTTDTVGSQSTSQILCTYGGVALSNLKFSSNMLSGDVENTRTITLGNITIEVLFTNASKQTQKLYLSLAPREKNSFNFSSSNNYNKIRATTNCSSVYDEADSSEVTT